MEAELIAELRRRIPPHPLVRLGPGDDAAVLQMAELDECVVTVDLLTDTVDFRLAEVKPRRVGRKALAVNLSDLAAMAARPLAAVVALALPRRDGLRLALDGDISIDGQIPVTTMGGLKARGHPVGATGIYQIVEVVQKLRGLAGENQVPDARLGMAQNIGGSGATVVTHILERMADW